MRGVGVVVILRGLSCGFNMEDFNKSGSRRIRLKLEYDGNVCMGHSNMARDSRRAAMGILHQPLSD